MNESIAQLEGLKSDPFLDRGQVEIGAKALRFSKVVIAVPVLVCALGVMIALAIILSPLIPFIELWRRSLCRRG